MTGLKRALGLGALLSVLSMASASNAVAAKITAVFPIWEPNTTMVAIGGSVEFENPETTRAHGVKWTSGPATPSCTGVPSTAQVGPWSGTCTFTTPGLYQFVSPSPEDEDTMIGGVTVKGPDEPSVSNVAGKATGDTTAVLEGEVNPNGIDTEYFFKYGPTASYGQVTPGVDAGGGTTVVDAAASISGLTPSTTYHLQLVAENSAGTVASGDRTFTTTGPPSATTGNTTGLGTNELTLLGTVNPAGHPTSYWFEWGTNTSYGQKTEVKSAGAGTTPVSVSAPLSGLSANTVYHYRLVSENEAGTGSGLDRAIVTRSDGSGGGPPPGGGQGPGPQPTGPALGPAVKATAAGKKVKVALEVLSPGSGGRVAVTLETKGAKPSKALAGKLSRAGVAPGKLSLNVPLNGRAKAILRKKGRISLKVKVVLTSPSGSSERANRSVTIKAR